MRIISKKNDYYDCIQRYGMDQTQVFVRKELKIPFKDADSVLDRFKNKYGGITFSGESTYTRKENMLYAHYYAISFCNQVIPAVLFTYEMRDVFGFTGKKRNRIFYNADEAVKYLHKLGIVDKFKNTRFSHRWGFNAKVRNFFNICDMNPVGFTDLHVERSSPVIIIDFEDRKVIVNGSLKDLEFFKVFDPYTTYQEISRYLFGVLGTSAPDMASISDKDMAWKKGFGHKYAFRKEPTK